MICDICHMICVVFLNTISQLPQIQTKTRKKKKIFTSLALCTASLRASLGALSIRVSGLLSIVFMEIMKYMIYYTACEISSANMGF